MVLPTLQKLASLMEMEEGALRQQLTCLKAKSYGLRWTQGADATQGGCKAAGGLALPWPGQGHMGCISGSGAHTSMLKLACMRTLPPP